MAIRNAAVSKDVREEKQIHLPAGTNLEVCAISNEHYQAIQGSSKLQGRRMNTALTGIPYLRTSAWQLPARAMMQTFVDYINQAQVLIKGAAGWADCITIKERAKLDMIVKEPRQVGEPLPSFGSC